MSNPYGNQQPYGQPPAPGNDPYAQKNTGYYGGQPYGPPTGGPPPQGGQPPVAQAPPGQAAPIVWEDHGRPSSAPWSGPGAFAPAPAQAAPAAPPASPAPPAIPAAAPATGGAPPAGAPSPADAPTTMTPSVGDVDKPASDDALSIGRGRSNSIVLDDMLVSRQHVRITADDEGLVLQDLDSRNGTFVNGRRVERTHLHEGDHIGVGASTFEVRDGWLVTI